MTQSREQPEKFHSQGVEHHLPHSTQVGVGYVPPETVNTTLNREWGTYHVKQSTQHLTRSGVRPYVPHKTVNTTLNREWGTYLLKLNTTFNREWGTYHITQSTQHLTGSGVHTS